MAVTMTAIYRQQEGDHFDHALYGEHLRLVRECWDDAGLTGVEAYRGLDDPAGGAAPDFIVTLLHFSSADALQAALAGPHFATVQADIARFTSIQPELRICAPL